MTVATSARRSRTGSAAPSDDGQVADDRATVARDDDPAGRQIGLDGEARRQVRQPRGVGQQSAGDAGPIAADRVGEDPATGRGERVTEPSLAGIGR